MLRSAAHAGRFYPTGAECRTMASDLLARAGDPPAGQAVIVPHAGWIYSGETAALGIKALASWGPETVIIFGAVHGPDPHTASVFPEGAWETPIGPVEVDADLASRLCQSDLLRPAPEQHHREHAIEVQLPLLKLALPEARVVPVSVRPGSSAPDIGRICATVAVASGRRIGFMASTDLTHYGPAFGFEPAGSGEKGVRWAKEVNDRRIIGLIEQMAADDVVREAAEHRNACGAGALASVIRAAVECGAVRYQELGHTTSAEVAAEWDRDVENSVGYTAGVFLT